MGKPKKTVKRSDRHRMKRLVCWLDPSYHQALRELAGRTRRTLTAEVRIALEEHLARKGIPMPELPPVQE